LPEERYLIPGNGKKGRGRRGSVSMFSKRKRGRRKEGKGKAPRKGKEGEKEFKFPSSYRKGIGKEKCPKKLQSKEEKEGGETHMGGGEITR